MHCCGSDGRQSSSRSPGAEGLCRQHLLGLGEPTELWVLPSAVQIHRQRCALWPWQRGLRGAAWGEHRSGWSAISAAHSPELNPTWSIWCWVVWNLNWTKAESLTQRSLQCSTSGSVLGPTLIFLLVSKLSLRHRPEAGWFFLKPRMIFCSPYKTPTRALQNPGLLCIPVRGPTPSHT